jgi:hypothetical protein
VLLRWGQKTEMSVALIWNAIYLILVCGLVLLLPLGLRENAGASSFAIGWWNAFAIFLMVRFINRLKEIEEKRLKAHAAAVAPPAPTTKECPKCYTAIPIKATRCPHCTSAVAPTPDVVQALTKALA